VRMWIAVAVASREMIRPMKSGLPRSESRNARKSSSDAGIRWSTGRTTSSPPRLATSSTVARLTTSRTTTPGISWMLRVSAAIRARLSRLAIPLELTMPTEMTSAWSEKSLSTWSLNCRTGDVTGSMCFGSVSKEALGSWAAKASVATTVRAITFRGCSTESSTTRFKTIAGASPSP